MNVPFTVCFSLYRLLLGSASSCSSNADQFTAVYTNGASVKNIYHTWQTLRLFQILAICCGFLLKTLHIAEKHTRRGQHQDCHNSRQVKIFYKKVLISENICAIIILASFYDIIFYQKGSSLHGYNHLLQRLRQTASKMSFNL